jgi:ribose 5-phosphate isomerase B
MVHLGGDKHAEPALQRIRSYLISVSGDYREYGYREGADPDAKLQEFIPAVAQAVQAEPDATGLLVCGTGAGVEIGANRFAGVRASLCSTPQAAEWARVYDAANVLCIAAWALPDLDIDGILNAWYGSSYDGSATRREMLDAFDTWAGA